MPGEPRPSVQTRIDEAPLWVATPELDVEHIDLLAFLVDCVVQCKGSFWDGKLAAGVRGGDGIDRSWRMARSAPGIRAKGTSPSDERTGLAP